MCIKLRNGRIELVNNPEHIRRFLAEGGIEVPDPRPSGQAHIPEGLFVSQPWDNPDNYQQWSPPDSQSLPPLTKTAESPAQPEAAVLQEQQTQPAEGVKEDASQKQHGKSHRARP